MNTNKKTTKGIIIENMDKNVSPRNNFFKYVNGLWIKNATIPKDKSGWGPFYALQEQTDEQLKLVFQSLFDDEYNEGSDEWKAMKYYDMAMDTRTIEKDGISICNRFFSEIEKCTNINEIIILSLGNIPIKSLFHLYPSADPNNSNMMIAGISQSGLGLPEKSFYFDTDEKAKNIREKYLVLLKKIYSLLGFNSNESIIQAKLQLKIETDIAEISKNNVELRDPISNTNKISFLKLQKTTRLIDWKLIFEKLKINNKVSIDVGQPLFIKNLDKIITKYSLDDWKKIFKSNFILSYYPYLNSEIENIVFSFYSKELGGIKEMEPRWKRKQKLICSDLRDAIGRIYIKKFFSKKSKNKMLELVNNLRKAFLIRLNNNSWMSNETKKKAIEKLNTMIFKIGYPDRWNNYSKLQILDSFLDTGVEMSKFDTLYGEHGLDKIGKPKDKTIWYMGPYVVNAYYNPTVNENVFPAGILQAPLFNIEADDAINYGAIGAVIAHEMTHGFDDSGKHYDKNGNLEEWGTKEDSNRFKKLTKKVVNQYNGYEVLPKLNVNGELVLGEAIADLGGLSIAYDGYKISLQEKNIDINESETDQNGFTHKQKFFIGFTQVWNGVRREESLRTMVKIDPHPPGEFRAIGTLSNLESFYSAFGVKDGDGMFLNKTKRCIIW